MNFYSSIFRLSLLLLTLVVGGCKQLDKLTQFDMGYSTQVVIPATAGVNLPFNVFTPDVQTNSSSSFAVNDTRKDLIESIILTDMKLRVDAPSGEDFSFLKAISIYISGEGWAEVKLAWNDQVLAKVGRELSLQTTGSDLQAYINAEAFQLRVEATTDELLAQDHTIAVDATFFVDAKILGQ